MSDILDIAIEKLANSWQNGNCTDVLDTIIGNEPLQAAYLAVALFNEFISREASGDAAQLMNMIYKRAY